MGVLTAKTACKLWIDVAFYHITYEHSFSWLFLIQIVFEAVRGYDIFGDIALDDVRVVVGDCPIYGIDDCGFEDETMCGYRQDPYNDFNFTRNSGSTITAGTGPAVDTTEGTSVGRNFRAYFQVISC